MQATSILDIYTSVLGWHVNNSTWSLLEQTGLFLIPFIAVVIRNLIQAQEQKDKADIGVLAFRLSEAKFYMMFFAILLLIKPTIYLKHDLVNYSNYACTYAGEAKESFPSQWGDTGSSLDRESEMIEATLDGKGVAIPILLYPLEFYARAFTESLKHSLPCQPKLRAMSETLTSARITDPQLKNETKRFYAQCWVPSGNRYLRESYHADADIYPNISEDVSWLGSKFFNEHPRLYGHDRTTTGVPSFPYVESRDSSAVSKEHSNGVGWPFCAEWWSSTEYGLRKRLLDSFNSDNSGLDQGSLLDTFKQFTQKSHATEREKEDVMLKNLLRSDLKLQTRVLSNNYTREQTGGFSDKIISGISQNIMGVGLALKQGGYSIEMQAYQYAATVIQSILLMLLTITFPLIAVIGSYRLDVIFSLILLKFSVIFWSFLFTLAFWLDNFLLDGIMDHSDAEGGILSFGAFFSDYDPTVKIISYITQSLYIVLPILFSSLMAVAGYSAGGGVGNMISSQGKASAGASRAGVDKVVR